MLKNLDEQEFGRSFNEEWRERYGTPIDLSTRNLSIEMLYARYRDYRGRALARLEDRTHADTREQRFADYRDRVAEISKAGVTLRKAASLLRWVGGIYIPHEIPDITGMKGPQPIPIIEPSSIPHTMRPVMWLSPFGPGPSPHGIGGDTTPRWMKEFEDGIVLLEGVARRLDEVVPGIVTKTIGQQDNADRRAFRRDFARLVSRANPGRPRMKLHGVGAVVFSFVFGCETDEETYKAQSNRDVH